jgi:pimeloyl-ACP methyl ester carboxylesterase
MKPLALLIPGLDGTGEMFYRQIAALSPCHRVLAWKFRDRSSFDFHDLVEELGEGTAGEEPGSILVVGESFGGTVAIHYVLAYPERVSCLALINTFPYYRPRRRILLGRRLVPFLRVKGLKNIKDFIVDRVLAREGVPEEDRETYRRIVQLVNLGAYQRRLELVQQVDLRPRLHEIAVPTLLFASGLDKIVSSIMEARFMASRIPDSTVYEFPKAGHALLLTPGFSLATYLHAGQEAVDKQ